MSLVSVLIPTYNRAGYIGGAIETALRQTYRDIEVVVVCDGSADGTGRVIEDYTNDDRVRVRYNDENRGISYSFNRAAEVADGEYYCILGDDDRWHPEKVQRQVERLSELDEEFGMLYTGGVVTDEDGRVIVRHRPKKRGDVYPEVLAAFDFEPHSSHMIKQRFYEAVGGFDVSLPRGVDWDMTIRLAKRCKIDYLPEVLVRRISHSSNVSEDPKQQLYGSLVWQKYRDEIVQHPNVARKFVAGWLREKARYDLQENRAWAASVCAAATAFGCDRSLVSAVYLGAALTGPTGFDATAAVRRELVDTRSRRLNRNHSWTEW
ncbi:glycosyltransferase family 2 protein [Halobium salinum]|uniref:Glycosyltransferase family 2 protein n=1 Tax=Halobium salinum TaxID=1364940 RepID=A0ABD5PI27_9EURY|nr:glycosyltransferase [Halobium salinum]